MYGEILQAVKALALAAASPYTSIEVGPAPAENGLSIYLGPGSPEEEYWDRGSLNSVDIVLNGKNSDQEIVVTALSNIHTALTRAKSYPTGSGWRITTIRTATSPNYISKEATGQWLYGSILEAQFEIKGV